MQSLYDTNYANEATPLSFDPLKKMIQKIKSQRGKPIRLPPRTYYEIISVEEKQEREIARSIV